MTRWLPSWTKPESKPCVCVLPCFVFRISSFLYIYFIIKNRYYNSYNNLDNRNSFLTREIEILDSISSQFNTAMSSKSNKDRFVEQLRSIKDSVCDSDSKVSGRLEQEKRSQTALSEKLNRLIDHERSYFKLVKEFQDACSKNEYLQQEAARAGIVLE